MKDTNFFQKNLKVDNIFSLIFRRDEHIKTGAEILQTYYFNHDSMKETPKKTKIPFFRDMSHFARLCILKKAPTNKYEILQSNEMTLSENDYNFATLMGIASGRSTPDDITKMILEGYAHD
jgi:hypothetical protein